MSSRPAGARPLAALLVLAALLGGCAGGDRDSLEREALEVRGGPPIPYTVVIDGTDDELATFLRAVSTAAAGVDDPPRSMLALRRRAASDEERLARALGSEGYYDATVTSTIAEADADGPARITFTAQPGPRYRLADVAIEIEGDGFGYRAPSPAELGLETGAPAVAQTVLDAENALVADARAASHHYAAAGDRDAVIDQDAKTMSVRLRLRPGPPIDLAAPTFTGIDGIEEDFLRRRVDWAPDAPYTPAAIRETNRALVGTGLFRTVEIQLPETAPDGPATVPVEIVTEQRLHRTISAGVRFETDGGPGGDVAWEHRNFLGAGETFRAALDADTLEQSLSASLRTPDFFGRSRSLLAEGEAVRESTDAFDSLAINARAGVEQRFTPELIGSLGLGYELSEVTEQGETTTFGLVFIPGLLRFDNTTAPLDPEDGVRARFEATPFWDLFDPDLMFQRFRLDGSTYLKLTDHPRLVLALRGAVGSIFGAERDDIPANRRFYAGGGGSIRGIPFQTAGPLDASDDPIGGRSLLELAAELRYRVTDSIGAVVFVDGGRAFAASFPDFDERLEIGAGAGVRYFTPIGPLRVDVAVPVDRRNVDDAFQFYVSLGQAF